MGQVILVLAGHMGAGKSTSARYLSEQYAATHLSFVDKIWLPILEERGVEPTRGNLQRLGIELKANFGVNGIVDRLTEHIEPGTSYVIDDVRSPQVYSYLKALFPQVKLVFLMADFRERFPRLVLRDGVASVAEQEAAERVETETSISDLVSLADYTVQNTQLFEDLQISLDGIALGVGLSPR